jgi:hypothetical protein
MRDPAFTEASCDAEPADGGGRALALTGPPVEAEDVEELRPIVRVRPDAGFVAQLIATAEDLPQTRQWRRADPLTAQTSYGRMARPAGPPSRPRPTSRVA